MVILIIKNQGITIMILMVLGISSPNIIIIRIHMVINMGIRIIIEGINLL